MNEMAYVLQAWLPLIVWQQVDAPQYQKGFITATFLSTLLIITAFTVRFLWKRELLRYVHHHKHAQRKRRQTDNLQGSE
jgi:ACS family pantothenate transporter-like MFS transporter